jgi:hypothetical protein
MQAREARYVHQIPAMYHLKPRRDDRRPQPVQGERMAYA